MGDASGTTDELPEGMHHVFEEAADVYDQSGVAFFRPIGRRLVERANLVPGESVLDVACGRGAALFPAAEAVGAGGSAVGIDMAESMLGHAARAAEQQGLQQVRTRVMDGQRPDFPPASFDAVLSSCGAVIWISGAEDLRPYRQLLRPGGRLLLSVPSFFRGQDGGVPLAPPAITDLIEPEMARMTENMSSRTGSPNPLTDPGEAWMSDETKIRSGLLEAGFAEVDLLEEELAIVFESGRQWVDWTMSHGMRAMWRNMPEQRAEELAGEIVDRLDNRGGGGPFTLRTPILYVRAVVANT